MKKMSISILVILFATSHLVAYSIDELLTNYVDSSYANAEFLIQNPLMYNPEQYYPDLDAVKGKIVKETLEEYKMWGNGNKAYGDSDIRCVLTRYYIFDRQGHITDMYSITKTETGDVFSKWQKQYSFTDDGYIISSKDFLNNNEVRSELYSLTQQNGSLAFQVVNKNTEYKYIFNHNYYSIMTLKNGELKEKSVYEFLGDTVKLTEFLTRAGVQSLNRKYEYTQGVVQLDSQYRPDGTDVYTSVYDIVSGIGYKTTKTPESESEKYVERRRGVAGFVEYEITRPLTDGDNGSYTIKTKEILETPDTFFIENFK